MTTLRAFCVHGLAVVLLGLTVAVAFAAQPAPSRITIDGKLDEGLWQRVRAEKLAPTEAGVPASMGGEVRAVIAGRYLYLGARLPEPSGRLTALAMGRDPVWQGGSEERAVTDPRMYTFGAPVGEDFVRFVVGVPDGTAWMVQVGPLGGYSIKYRRRGEQKWHILPPERCDRFLVAARVEDKAWSMEAAIPLDQLGSGPASQLRLNALRNRAERPDKPREQWRWPSQEPSASIRVLAGEAQRFPHPIFRPPPLGNQEPPIEVGYRKILPSLGSGWTGAEWRGVPALALRRNEAAGRLPRFPTEVKLVHDGRTLAVLARCTEPDRVIAQARPRDGLSAGEDYFQICLAAFGRYYVEYAINPAGSILDARGFVGELRNYRYPWSWWRDTGGKVMPDLGWNSPVRGMAREKRGQWLARLDLPLQSISEALGEEKTPRRWRILLLRSRPARDGEPQEVSVLPITESLTPFCPARYRRLDLTEKDTSQVEMAGKGGAMSDLAQVPSRVLSPEQRKQRDLAGMLNRNIRNQVLRQLEKEARDWEKVNTLADWERFRAQRMRALRRSIGPFPPRVPLRARVTSTFRGDGYRRENLVFQSQRGLWVTADLYLPAEPKNHMPGIVFVAGHHADKTHFDFQDAGILWAQVGCAVLVMDQIGFGERTQTYPWDYEGYYSKYDMGEQLSLIGSNLTNWMVWDTMRGIDLLLALGDVDMGKIIVLGAVAGGGDPAAVIAALDPRVAAVAPFNVGDAAGETDRANPETNQWPLDLADPGPVGWDPVGIFRSAIAGQFLEWTICASVAPRRFIFSHEVGWNVHHEPAWSRYRKVFELCGALNYLAEAHGFGPYPGPGECYELGAAERQSLYPILHRWFGIPIPQADMAPVKENVAKRSVVLRQPVTTLAVLTPAVAGELAMRSLDELAGAQGAAELKAARSSLDKLRPSQRIEWLRTRWGDKLGDIEPNRHLEATVQWSKEVANAEVQGITLESEPGIVIPMLLLRPKTPGNNRIPVVVAVSEEGKSLFLARRGDQIELLLKRGVAVCLPDVRGTGETTPDSRRDASGDESDQANWELMLGDTLLGKRLKDLRTVIAYLRGRKDLDAHRIGLWGDSFQPPNPAHLLIDEPAQWQIGPQIEQEAEPLGGLLALLGGLYENNVRTIAVQSGLASYLSVLNENYAYVPLDTIVPGILSIGDIADVAAALAPRTLLLKGLVDGQDRLVSESRLKRQLEPVYEAYRGTSAGTLSIQSGEGASGIAKWFLGHL